MMMLTLIAEASAVREKRRERKNVKFNFNLKHHNGILREARFDLGGGGGGI
jgi:hypothetical protein